MWRPADFILRGEYCPVAALEEQLAIYRERYGFGTTVLFTVSTEPGHVPVVVHDSSEGWQDTTAAIMTKLRGDDPLQPVVRAEVFADRPFRKDRLRDVAASLQDDLRLAPDMAVVTMSTPGHMNSNQPVRPVLVTIGAPGAQMVRRHRELLFSMLATTVDVREAIDSAALTPLDELLLIPEISDDGVIDLDEMTARGVQHARFHSRSDRAAIHWRGTLAEEPPGQGSEVTAILAGLGDPAELLREMHRIKLARQYVDEHCVVLACPIPGVLAGPEAPAAGVLLLRRDRRHLYTSHTIALGRAVCIRLAVVRATAASGEVARLTSVLSDLTPVDPGQSASSDVDLALRGIEPALRQIAANTNSHSATVRLARGRVGTSDSHGMVLERVAAVASSETGGELDLVQQEETAHGGINWRAVSTGRFVYSPDVDAEPDYLKAREETRSQLSLPIRTAGHLIGTLNLESASLANYGAYLPYAQATADAIGRRIAAASVQAGRPVLERAAQVLDRTHTYETRLLDLQMHARSLKLDAASISRIDAYVEECLGLIGSAVRLSEQVEPTERIELLGESVERALGDRPVLDLKAENDWTDVPALNRPVSPLFGQIVHSATRSILSNMKKHAGAVYNRSAPTIWFGECMWDGRSHATIVFTNSTDRILPPAVADQVYRVPIDRNGELRLGAHLAGLQLQMVHGWISFDVDVNGIAKTVLTVPSPAREGDGQL
jgi:GAF domain-containing protein